MCQRLGWLRLGGGHDSCLREHASSTCCLLLGSLAAAARLQLLCADWLAGLPAALGLLPALHPARPYILACPPHTPPRPGALEGAKAAFGMHVWPTLPSGSVRSRAGTIMAGAVQFDALIKGRGGHAAMPHLTRDPVVAASAVVGALQVGEGGWVGCGGGEAAGTRGFPSSVWGSLRRACLSAARHVARLAAPLAHTLVLHCTDLHTLLYYVAVCRPWCPGRRAPLSLRWCRSHGSRLARPSTSSPTRVRHGVVGRVREAKGLFIEWCAAVCGVRAGL